MTIFLRLRSSNSFQHIILGAGLFVGLIPAFPNQAAGIVLLLSIITFSATALKHHWLFLTLITQYFVIQLGWNVYHHGGILSSRINDSYILMAISTPFILSLLVAARDNNRQLMSGLQIGLLVSSILIIADFIGLDGAKTCRPSVGASNPLIASFLLTLTIPLLLQNWASASASQQTQRLIIFSVLASFLITVLGSRMAFYAIAGLLPFIAIFLMRNKRVGPNLVVLSLSFIVALIFGAALNASVGCDNLARVSNTVKAIEFLSDNFALIADFSDGTPQNIIEDGMPLSEAYRFAFWHAAWEAIQAHPFTGYGHYNESALLLDLTQIEQPHTHSQPLSWMLWGGVTSLASGLIFGFAAIIALPKPAFASVIAVVAAGAVLLTDTLLYWPTVLHGTVPLLIFAYALGLSRSENNGRS